MKTQRSKTGILDEYDRNARLKPALLTILPVSILIATQGATFSVAIGGLAGPLTAIGFTYVLAEFARDWGKRKEPYLFGLWGGKPTTAKLRHRDGTINVHTLARYHAAADQLIGKVLPTVQEEQADPVSADLVYESVGDQLREKTRDKQKFPLVFKELVSYGFRRNLWGMKSFGATLACFCVGLQLALIVARLLSHSPLSYLAVSATILNALLLCAWIFIVNPRWVRIPADAYAERILAACPELETKPLKRAPARNKAG